MRQHDDDIADTHQMLELAIAEFYFGAFSSRSGGRPLPLMPFAGRQDPATPRTGPDASMALAARH